MRFTAYASSSSGNLYTVEDGKTSLIIECGVSYREMQRLLPKSPMDYDGCVYSHHHGDHYHPNAVRELTVRGLPPQCGLMFQHGETIGTMQVRSFPVKHDCRAHGYMFRGECGETCVFMVDTFYCPVVPKFSPTIVAIECNYARDLLRPGDSINDRLFASHMSLEQCVKTLQAWDLKATREVHLLHLSDDRSDEKRFVREVQEAIGLPTHSSPKRR
ncbi:MAG: hypothetical protein HGB04_06705 [Chlorobiaceae bacterium]|nr:hypothetical protein [Chlorobiaceae bacterium]